MTSRSLFRRTTSIACSLALLFSVFVALGFSLVQANAGAATGPGTAVLSAGQQLLPGQELDDGPYRAVMQTDGNFVVYNASTPMWSTHTSGHMNQGFHLVMQGDGNLVMYSGSGAVKWATYRFGSSPVLVLWNNGNLIVFGASAPLWASGVTGPVYTPPTSSPTSTSSTTTSSTTTTTTSTTTTTAPRANSICSVTADTLQSGCVMTEGQAIQSGTTLLWLQSGFTAPTLNGNLVLYPNFVSLMNTGPASWTTFTFDNPSTSHHALVMEAGGNLVLYSQWISAASHGPAVWSAKASTPSMTLVPGSFLQVLSNGNLIIKTPGGATAWATGTVSAAAPTAIAARVVTLATANVGYHANPFPGGDCNMFTAAFARGSTWDSNTGAQCVAGTMSESWCSDFANFVWAWSAVNTTGLTGYSYSFVTWGQNHGTFKAGPANNPQVGDAVVWATGQWNSAHIATVVGVIHGAFGAPIIKVLSGNDGNSGVSVSGYFNPVGDTIDGDPIIGYSSPA